MHWRKGGCHSGDSRASFNSSDGRGRAGIDVALRTDDRCRSRASRSRRSITRLEYIPHAPRRGPPERLCSRGRPRAGNVEPAWAPLPLCLTLSERPVFQNMGLVYAGRHLQTRSFLSPETHDIWRTILPSRIMGFSRAQNVAMSLAFPTRMLSPTNPNRSCGDLE